tara:strand:- start:161 stop:679 length:519 start_codon:yes stop_codon:yes gene_type:complete
LSYIFTIRFISLFLVAFLFYNPAIAKDLTGTILNCEGVKDNFKEKVVFEFISRSKVKYSNLRMRSDLSFNELMDKPKTEIEGWFTLDFIHNNIELKYKVKEEKIVVQTKEKIYWQNLITADTLIDRRELKLDFPYYNFTICEILSSNEQNPFKFFDKFEDKKQKEPKKEKQI